MSDYTPAKQRTIASAIAAEAGVGSSDVSVAVFAAIAQPDSLTVGDSAWPELRRTAEHLEIVYDNSSDEEDDDDDDDDDEEEEDDEDEEYEDDEAYENDEDANLGSGAGDKVDGAAPEASVEGAAGGAATGSSATTGTEGDASAAESKLAEATEGATDGTDAAAPTNPLGVGYYMLRCVNGYSHVSSDTTNWHVRQGELYAITGTRGGDMPERRGVPPPDDRQVRLRWAAVPDGAPAGKDVSELLPEEMPQQEVSCFGQRRLPAPMLLGSPVVVVQGVFRAWAFAVSRLDQSHI